MRFIILSLFVAVHIVFGLDTTILQLVKTFTDTFKLSFVTIYVCETLKDSVATFKYLSESGVRVQICSQNQYQDVTGHLVARYYSVGVVVDLKCDGTMELLKEATYYHFYSRLNHWLLLGTEGSAGLPDFRNITIPLDSHVILSRKDAANNSRYILQDIYTLASGYNTTFSEPRKWIQGEPISPGPTRDNYQGLELRAGIVVLEDDWEYRADMRRKHLNTWSKINYALMLLVSEMLNFTMKEFQVSDWGYLNTDGSFTGLVGALQKDVGDIGAVACIITPSRMDAVDYTAETIPFRPRFVFRQPSLSSVSNIYILPFTVGVWVTYFGTALILTTLLAINSRLHKSLILDKHPSPDDDWIQWFIYSLALVCQQGCPRSPDNVSSRIIFMFLLLLSMFFFNSYSAIIVSLLQTPSSSIKTLRELVSSPIKLAMHDIVYNYNHNNYVNDSSAPLVKKLFEERIYSRPKEEVFLSQERGAELMRKGLFAIHVDLSVYKIIADTWLETEKCDVKEVFMFPAYKFSIPVKKHSPYREHITHRLRILRETGLLNREWEKWVTQKPVCKDNHMGFVSVGLQEFHPVLLVIAYGVATSIGALILENGYNTLVNRQLRRPPAPPQTTPTGFVVHYYN